MITHPHPVVCVGGVSAYIGRQTTPMTIRGIRSAIRTRRSNELGTAPKKFVDAVIESGVLISTLASSAHAETYIPTGSAMWRNLVAQLAALPKSVHVSISIDDHILPGILRSTPDGFTWDLYELYVKELERELGKVNPDGAGDRYRVRGDTRWLVEALVIRLEDPPAGCRVARALPEGQFMLSVRIEFRDLELLVAIYRKNSGPLSVFPAVENRQPYYI